jgi:hypothetical protein
VKEKKCLSSCRDVNAFTACVLSLSRAVCAGQKTTPADELLLHRPPPCQELPGALPSLRNRALKMPVVAEAVMRVGRGSRGPAVHRVPKYAVAAADAALAATVVAETPPAVVRPPRRPPRPCHPMHGRRACPVAWVSALRGPRLPVGRSSRKKQLRVGTARWLCSGPCPEVSACLGSYDRVLLRPSRCADVPTPASESGQRDCGERASTIK